MRKVNLEGLASPSWRRVERWLGRVREKAREEEEERVLHRFHPGCVYSCESERKGGGQEEEKEDGSSELLVHAGAGVQVAERGASCLFIVMLSRSDENVHAGCTELAGCCHMGLENK